MKKLILFVVAALALFLSVEASAKKSKEEKENENVIEVTMRDGSVEKSVEMIHVKDINAITGYIRGGCTAVGMKKQYVTRIDSSADGMEKIIVSGGRIGSQLELAPKDLARACGAEFADVVRR